MKALFENIFPKPLSKDSRKQLLGYAGPLGSFYARIEVGYTLRLIDRRLYEALHALRRIRNDVAHELGAFRLQGQEDRLNKIYALGPDVAEEIRKMASEMMSRYKVDKLLNLERERAEQGDPEYEPMMTSRQVAADFIRNNPEIMESLREELPQWEMVIGITLICSSILLHQERAAQLVGEDSTLTQVLARRKKGDSGQT